MRQIEGTVFTGIHSETDWTETRQWSKGISRANASGDYAVVWVNPNAAKSKSATKVSAAKKKSTRKSQSSMLGGVK